MPIGLTIFMVNIHQLQMISYEQEAHRTSQDV